MLDHICCEDKIERGVFIRQGGDVALAHALESVLPTIIDRKRTGIEPLEVAEAKLSQYIKIGSRARANVEDARLASEV